MCDRDPRIANNSDIACIQLDVTDGGNTSLPAGTQAKSLYEPNDAFANINVMLATCVSSHSFDPSKVEFPGPPIWDVVSSGSNGADRAASPANAASATSASTTAAAATTIKKATTPTTTTSGVEALTSRACNKRRQGEPPVLTAVLGRPAVTVTIEHFPSHLPGNGQGTNVIWDLPEFAQDVM
ncbi:hypothetical protein DFH06DRAFT_1132744 [Mycena polygramma]|nr:hypothetical protein DFH06DRAFT_1132744 [Mycena polygramma]